MSSTNQPRPNLPPRENPLEFLPSLGTQIDVAPTTRQNSGIVDREKPPAVPVRKPDWIKDQIDVGPTPAPVNAGTVPPSFSTPSSSANAGFQNAQAYEPELGAAQHTGLGSVPPAQPGSVPGSVRVPNPPNQHPVVDALLRSLGYDESKLVHVELSGFKFTMRRNPAEVFAYTLSVVSKSSSTNDEAAMRLAMTLAALSVIKINGEPIWNLFGIDVSKAGQFDDNNPPFLVVAKTASAIIDLFFNQLDWNVINKLADTYSEHWGDDDDESLLAQAAKISPDDQRVRFKCQIEGCNHVEDVVPDKLDAKGSVRSRFCPEHGPTMSPSGYLRDLANVPLD
jgi:hypothetical protein